MDSSQNVQSGGYPPGYIHPGYGSNPNCRRGGTVSTPNSMGGGDVFHCDDHDSDRGGRPLPINDHHVIPVSSRDQESPSIYDKLLRQILDKLELIEGRITDLEVPSGKSRISRGRARTRWGGRGPRSGRVVSRPTGAPGRKT